MNNSSLNKPDDLRNKVDLFLSKWKIIALCLIITVGCAYIYMRYATYTYESQTSIKLKNEKQQKPLQEISSLQDYGLFSKDFGNIKDEIEVLKSRSLINQVVNDLKLNHKYYIRGNIKEQEVYENPPIVITFFDHDSILSKIDTTLYIKIKSPTKFTISGKANNEILDIESSSATTQEFGKKIKTTFGEIIITPNNTQIASLPGNSIKFEIIPVKKVVEYYQDKIKISTAEEGSNIVTIALEENVKEKAEQILDKLVVKYNEDVVTDKNMIIKATSDFINSRLDVVSNELEQVDFTAETLQKSNRLTALASQSDIFLQSEKENEVKLITTSNQIQLIDYMKDYLADNNKNSDLLPADVGIADNSVSQITKSHNDLVMQRNRILKNSTDKNPTVVNLNNQIEALKNNLNQSLNNIKSANQITLGALSREDQRISSQIYQAPTKARQFRDANRQQSIKESLYLYLLQKREETAITLGMSSPNAKIIDLAFTSSIPVNPKKSFTYLAALVLGLIIPMGFIYFGDLLSTKVKNKKDLTDILKIPYLGDIPKSQGKSNIINKIDYTPKAEAFRIIRSNVDFMLRNKVIGSKTIFVTSTKSQEGKSHTSVNLASSLSFSKKRVLLIESDIRVPKVEKYLKMSAKKGLSDYVSDPLLSLDDVIVSIKDNPFLSIITSGTIPPNPAELLMDDRIELLFEKVKSEYDYIIVDTAAVGLVSDTFLISKFADMFIYVVSANNLDKRQLHIAQTLYDEKRLPNMTVLLNGTVSQNGYGYGYGNNPLRKKKWYQFN